MTLRLLRFMLASFCFLTLVVTLSSSRLSLLGGIMVAVVKIAPVLAAFLLVQASLVRKAGQKKLQSDERQRQGEFVESVQRRCAHKPVVAVVIGGSGFDLPVREVLLVSCIADQLMLSNIRSGNELAIPFAQILNIDITGPGTVSTHAGLIGGGFGVQGALEGILVASTINALTTKTSTHTLLRISTGQAEVHLHTAMMEPAELRLVLSPAIVAMEASKHHGSWPTRSIVPTSDELQKLHRMHLDGVLSQEEFTRAKERVLSVKV